MPHKQYLVQSYPHTAWRRGLNNWLHHQWRWSMPFTWSTRLRLSWTNWMFHWRYIACPIGHHVRLNQKQLQGHQAERGMKILLSGTWNYNCGIPFKPRLFPHFKLAVSNASLVVCWHRVFFFKLMTLFDILHSLWESDGERETHRWLRDSLLLLCSPIQAPPTHQSVSHSPT